MGIRRRDKVRSNSFGCLMIKGLRYDVFIMARLLLVCRDLGPDSGKYLSLLFKPYLLKPNY